MALTVVSDNSKIGTGIQIGLTVDNQGNADSVFVTAGATVASTTAIAISGISDSHVVNVEGTVIGEDTAIGLGVNGQSHGHKLVIGQTGYVGNISAGTLAAPSTAIIIRGYNSVVENAGTIRGAAQGLTFEGDSPILSGTVSVNNTGLIEATRAAIVHADNSDQTLILKNTGEIRSTYMSQVGSYYSAIYSGGTASDFIYNSGLIVGGIGLGGGDDLYDGRGGRVAMPLAGDAFVDGGSGQDTLIGGDFRDVFGGSGGDDDIDGGNGDDLLFGGSGEDQLVGGAGDDEISADDDVDTVNGDAGNDKIAGGAGNDIISGGADNDQIKGDDGDDTLSGDAGNDVIEGGAGKDTISGGAGDDQLNGQSDDDTISGDAGNDLLDGGAGKDTISGGADNDTIIGGSEDDKLSGDAGNDTLNGGTGADAMDGSAGNDSFVVDDANDVVSDFGGGIDRVQSSVAFNLGSVGDAKGTVENLTLTGSGNIAGTGNAFANIVTGNAGNNLLLGLSGNDSLIGNGGNDTLKGDAGNDVSNGGIGSDRLHGGLGNDAMTGGAQADQFVFDSKANATANRDTITDFQHNLDDMWLDNAVFAKLGGNGALKAAFFFAGKAAHDADDHIIYNKAAGALFYDADGTGAQAQVQFATLSTKPLLTASDFVVI